MTIREKFMKEFDLFSIEELRKEFKCREGLLIDYDYATVVAELVEASKETTVMEGESEDLGKDTQSQENNLNFGQKPSGDRTVSFFFNTCFYLLRCLAGYFSFHCNGVTEIRNPPWRCTRP
jgi:hypothetical protein